MRCPDQMVIDANILPKIITLLASDRPNITKEAMWVLVNIFDGADSENQIQYEHVYPHSLFSPCAVHYIYFNLNWSSR
jgi:hypothetical protein